MTFEEFEKATPAQLRELAKTCFDNSDGHGWPGKEAMLTEAQFYMMEMDRRHDGRIAGRDFRMELVVIALIGLELLVSVGGIIIGIRESNAQSQVSQKQIEMLDKIEKVLNPPGATRVIH